MRTDLTDRPLLVTAVGGAPGFDLARMLLHAGYQVIAHTAQPRRMADSSGPIVCSRPL